MRTRAVRSTRRPGPQWAGARRQFAGETPEEADKAAELLADLQRVQAEFANYRKRALRDQQLTAERAKAAVIAQLLRCSTTSTGPAATATWSPAR